MEKSVGRHDFQLHMKSTGDMVVGHPQDLPKGSSSGEVVKVTATSMPSAAQERQMQRGRSMDY